MAVAGWTCPSCRRRFAHRGQAHECEPAISMGRYFADRPAVERKICDAVTRHLKKLGPLVVEAVGVGILFKRGRTFAELRPRRDGLALSIILARTLTDPRVTRRIQMSPRRVAHFVVLRKAADVDADVRSWLTEGWLGPAALGD